MRPITERMADAKAGLISRKRTPRVFFLAGPDFAEFEATGPGTIEAMFALPLGSKPSPMTCLAFDGTAVRPTNRKPDRYGRLGSNLYCCNGRSIAVPRQ